MLRNTGIVLGLVGILAGLVGALWQVLFPTPDANIGAGILVVVGLPLAAIGIVLVLSSILLDRRKSRSDTRS